MQNIHSEGLLYETKEWSIKLLSQRVAIKSIDNKVLYIRNSVKPLKNTENFAEITEEDMLKIYSNIFNNEKKALKTKLET